MPEGTVTDGSSTTDGNNNTSGSTSTAGDEFTPITSQEDLNRVLSDRLTRERAKYADYKELKAKATRLDEIEAANQTEAEKAARALADAEAAATEARAEALRYKVAAKFKVSDDDAELFLTGTDEETLTRQAQRLTERTTDARTGGNRVPREGTNTTSAPSDERTAVRDLFGAT